MKVVDFEMLPWEMTSLLCGDGPLELLLDTGETIIVKAGLGPGYWRRIHNILNEKGIEPGVLPHADGTMNWEA